MGERVLGKAVGGEPVELEVIAVVGKAATVRRIIGDRILSGYSLIRDLYRYDEGIARELRSAYSKNDSRTLDRVWARAVPLSESAQ